MEKQTIDLNNVIERLLKIVTKDESKQLLLGLKAELESEVAELGKVT